MRINVYIYIKICHVPDCIMLLTVKKHMDSFELASGIMIKIMKETLTIDNKFLSRQRYHRTELCKTKVCQPEGVSVRALMND